MDYRVSRFAVLSSSSHYPAGRPGWVCAFQARPQFSFIRLGFCLAQYPPRHRRRESTHWFPTSSIRRLPRQVRGRRGLDAMGDMSSQMQKYLDAYKSTSQRHARGGKHERCDCSEHEVTYDRAKSPNRRFIAIRSIASASCSTGNN
jgi:hypothetical protein